MDSETLKNLSFALGVGGTIVKRQKEVFEYVIKNSDKSQDELTEEVLAKNNEFRSTLTKAARRIILTGRQKKLRCS